MTSVPAASGESIRPATSFWDGYKRPPAMTSLLIAALARALDTHPEQRLGQLIINACGELDPFNIYDENLLAELQKMSHNGGSPDA